MDSRLKAIPPPPVSEDDAAKLLSRSCTTVWNVCASHFMDRVVGTHCQPFVILVRADFLKLAKASSRIFFIFAVFFSESHAPIGH